MSNPIFDPPLSTKQQITPRKPSFVSLHPVESLFIQAIPENDDKGGKSLTCLQKCEENSCVHVNCLLILLITRAVRDISTSKCCFSLCLPWWQATAFWKYILCYSGGVTGKFCLHHESKCECYQISNNFVVGVWNEVSFLWGTEYSASSSRQKLNSSEELLQFP